LRTISFDIYMYFIASILRNIPLEVYFWAWASMHLNISIGISLVSKYIYQFWKILRYYLLYNHLSSLPRVKYGFKLTYNVVAKIRLFNFFGVVFRQKLQKTTFHYLWILRVKSNLFITLNGIHNVSQGINGFRHYTYVKHYANTK